MQQEATVKCPICGKPYKVYAMMVGDQSACPACVAEAETATRRQQTRQEYVRMKDFFNR